MNFWKRSWLLADEAMALIESVDDIVESAWAIFHIQIRHGYGHNWRTPARGVMIAGRWLIVVRFDAYGSVQQGMMSRRRLSWFQYWFLRTWSHCEHVPPV